MQHYFYDLAGRLCTHLKGEEVLLLRFRGEESDFVRFNRSAVRQAGHVTQSTLSLELIRGKRHASATGTLGLSKEADADRMRATLQLLRETLDHVPDDPYLAYATEVCSTEERDDNHLPEPSEALQAILAAGHGRDMVGLFSQGGIFSGFANSLGQRNWYTTHTFNVSFSFYHTADKAVKTAYAGRRWSPDAFGEKVDQAAQQLAVLKLPPKTIQPGRYRVYLAPSALRDIFDLLALDGFSLKAHRTKTTPFLRMIEAGALLSGWVTLRENTRQGTAPRFQDQGYLKPDCVDLIVEGRYQNCLVSPRSAAQYGAATNGAGGKEAPLSLDMGGGVIPAAEVCRRLGTGLYVNHTWYLNYSDRPGGRITGMTRFATFRVERGRIVAPVNVMRFDETLYRFLGPNLLGLTVERDFLPDESTYCGRSTESMRLPGALIEDFTFTL